MLSRKISQPTIEITGERSGVHVDFMVMLLKQEVANGKGET